MVRAEKRLEHGNRSLLAQFCHLAKQKPHLRAIGYFDAAEKLTLDRMSLYNAICAAGSVLRKRGVTAGDRIVLWGDNSVSWLIAYFGILAAGATVVPLDFQSTDDKVQHIIEFTECKLMIRCPSLSNTFTVPAGVTELNVNDFSSHRLPASGDEPVPRSTNAIQVIIFTSGTTGDPKGVVLRDANILANVHDIMLTRFINERESILSILPYFHAYSLTASVVMPLYAGMSISLSPTLKADDLRRTMRVFKPTIMVAVPRLLRLLVDGIHRSIDARGISRRPLQKLIAWSSAAQTARKFNLWKWFLWPVRRGIGPGLRYIMSGGSKLDADVTYALEALGFEVYEGYGLTETSPILTLNPYGKPKPGTVGKPLESVEIKLIDEKDGMGEILAQGPNIFSEYYMRPDLTASVFLDGWFRTGDLGRIDSDGYLSIEGRVNEMIVTEGGKNIFPEEIEAKFNACPFISECCLVHEKLDGGASRLTLVVVPDNEVFRQKGEHEVYRTLRYEVTELGKGLPSYCRPVHIVPLMTELPKTRLGKIRRHIVADMLKGKTEDGNESEADTAMDAIETLIAKYLRRKYVAGSQHLEIDLGIDSLGKMDLVSYLETELDAHISQESAASAQTVEELKNAVTASGATIEEVPGEVTVPPLTAGKRVIQYIADPILHLFLKMKMNYRSIKATNLPSKGSFIIAPNHISLLDAIVLRDNLPNPARHKIMYLSIGKYFDQFPMSIVSWATRIIVIGRRNTPAAAYKILEKALSDGNPAVIFPEGERSPDGTPQEPRHGAFRLAASTGSDVYPVALVNLYGFMSRGGEKHSNRVSVAFGEPIRMSQIIASLPPSHTTTDIERMLAREWLKRVKELLERK